MAKKYKNKGRPHLSELGRIIVYRPPAHARDTTGLYFKRPSYEAGQYPEQLKAYAGQIRECPTKCKGRKGQAYRLCLKTCAASYKKG